MHFPSSAKKFITSVISHQPHCLSLDGVHTILDMKQAITTEGGIHNYSILRLCHDEILNLGMVYDNLQNKVEELEREQ